MESGDENGGKKKKLSGKFGKRSGKSSGYGGTRFLRQQTSIRKITDEPIIEGVEEINETKASNSGMRSK